MSPKRDLRPPKVKGGPRIKVPEELPDYDGTRPQWDFEHVVPGYRLADCTEEHRAAFAVGMEKRSGLTWRQIKSLKREQLGFELISVSQIQPALPARIVTPDVDKVLVFRCGQLRRLIGVRQQQVFIVLLFDASGACYSHGS